MFDLRPQPLDVDVDQPRGGRVPVPPHLVEQDLAGEHLPRLARQAQQQIELERGEGEFFAVTRDPMPGDIDGEVADLECLRRRLLMTAHPRAYAGDELLR